MALVTEHKGTQKSTRKPKNKKKQGGYLDQANADVRDSPMACFIYGPPGVGKTATVAHAPDVIFMVHPQEQGIHDLKSSKVVPQNVPVLPPVEDWEQGLDMLDELASKDHPYQFLAIDAALWFEDLCFKHVVRTQYRDNWDQFYSYWKGPKISAKRYWPEFVRRLQAVRDNGVHVIVLGHSETVTITNPEGEDWAKAVPRFNEKQYSFERIEMWAEAIGYMNYYVEVESEGLKSKARNAEYRYLNFSSPTQAFVAKNRWGIDDVIDMGDSPKEAWNNFWNSYKKIKGL